MDRWQQMETGPYTIAEISGLEPHSVYAVRVRAKGPDGTEGNFSEIITSTDIIPSRSSLTIIAILYSACFSGKPDMVEQFLARTSNPTSIMLEWKPPQKPGVVKYKVILWM
jgi:netrin-G3 ligand